VSERTGKATKCAPDTARKVACTVSRSLQAGSGLAVLITMCSAGTMHLLIPIFSQPPNPRLHSFVIRGLLVQVQNRRASELLHNAVEIACQAICWSAASCGNITVKHHKVKIQSHKNPRKTNPKNLPSVETFTGSSRLWLGFNPKLFETYLVCTQNDNARCDLNGLVWFFPPCLVLG
jgi:hypothetical protein